MKIINMKKFNKVLILRLFVFVLANCAGTNVTTYSSASIMLDDFIEQNGGKGAVNDETLHYPLDIQTLSCSEMQANRIRISNLINNFLLTNHYFIANHCSFYQSTLQSAFS